jgi:DNA primase
MAIDIVQEIKERTDLVELISAYVPLKRSGRAHKGLCPFHSEKTPSFTVDGERGFYKCYGCGAGGDCFSFIQQKEGLSFNEAGELLARKAGLEWVRRGETVEARSQRQRLYDIVALAERYYVRCLQQSREVRQYLEGRGLLPETIEQFRLGYAPPGYRVLLAHLREQQVSLEDALQADVLIPTEEGVRDRFVDRLIFPIFDLEGRAVGFGGRTLRADGVPKYLNSKETPIFQKGKTLYGLHLSKRAIPAAGFTVAVEGYMDLIALHQAGIANSVASLGTAITETNVGILRRYSDQLVMCYDGDSAGMRAALENSAKFEAAGCHVRVARLPEGEDPDTYIKRHGADSFRALLNRAEPLLDYQLNRLSAAYNLSEASARLPFVQEAARIIAQSGSHLTRQEYAGKLTQILQRLAEQWYPGNPKQAQQAWMALIQEVNRLLRIDRSGGWGRREAPPEVRPPAAPASARSRAERDVLRAALTEDRWAECVVERLTAEYFEDPLYQGIANVLLGNNGVDPPLPASERAAFLRKSPEYAEKISALVLEETPLSDKGLEECVLELERGWKQKRVLELKQARDAGELGPGDPRLEEFLRLRSELGGQRRRED